MPSDAFRIRAAMPADIPILMDMKRQLVLTEGTAHALRATAQDWLRLGFGADARFSAFLAEQEGEPVGMVTWSQHYYTGWPEPVAYVGDLFVLPACRGRGIARALLGRVAERALAQSCSVIELTVSGSNPAQDFYQACGFGRVENCMHYVAGADAMVALAQATQAVHSA